MEALAFFGGVGIAVVAVLTMGLKAISAERRAGEQKARADSLDVNLADVTARYADVAKLHREEKERADALENAWLAAIASEPVAGAHDRMLQALAAARAARDHGDGARALPDGGRAAEPRRGDTDLLAPGE